MAELEQLEQLGERARTRPEPTLRGAIAAAGGVLVAFGFVIIGLDKYGTDGVKALGVALGVVLVVAGYGAILKLTASVRPAAVAMIALGIPIAVLFAFADNTDKSSLILLLLAVAWSAAYLGPHARGELVLLVGALGSLWGLLLDLAASDGGSSEAFVVGGGVVPDVAGDDTVTYLSLLVGLFLLAAAWALDKDGWLGVATGFVVVGNLAFVTGVFGVVGTLESEAGGSILVIVAGVVLATVGSLGGRRLTTWLGGIGVTVGLVALISSFYDSFDDAVPFGIAAAVVGVVVIMGVGYVTAEMLQRDKGETTATAEPAAAPDGEGATDPAPSATESADPEETTDADNAPAAAWHPDPHGRHQMRWWDGSQWTDQVSDDGTVSTDPEGA